MRLLWEDRARDDYLYWQTQGKKTLKKINMLIKDTASFGIALYCCRVHVNDLMFKIANNNRTSVLINNALKKV
ncbi:MAG: type II toxin-antitoxin system YoeB family toxin [Lachnospiraceae bacterium]|nr:type II toxin-antitoxin system YoeB family toxin [Lachnospiraceae bacterium]